MLFKHIISYILLYIIFYIVFFPLYANGTCTNDEQSVNNEKALQIYAGNRMPYPSLSSYSYSPVPLGYSIFYINYFGCPGASGLSTLHPVEVILPILENEAKKGYLTHEGVVLQGILLNIREFYANRLNKLSTTGVTELSFISKRMLRNHPGLFDVQHQPLSVHAATLPTELCLNSMYVFIQNLKNNRPKINYTTDYGDKYLKILAPYEQNSNYLKMQSKGVWTTQINAFAQRNINSERFIHQFIKYEDRLDPEIQYTVMKNIFFLRNDLLASNSSLFDKYFTIDELKALWEIENLKDYLGKYAPFYDNPIITYISAPALMDMITSSDNAINKKNHILDLHITYQDTFLSLVRLLNLEEITDDYYQEKEVSKYWQNYSIIPTACNIQWLLYRNEHGDILVKVLLNEQEVTLPFPSEEGKYYSWEKMRRYYAQKIIRILPILNSSL